METKKFLLTREQLIEKINNYETESRVYVVYFDVIDKSMMSFASKSYTLFKLDDNNVFTVKDAEIPVYKALVDTLKKYDNGKRLLNRLVPKSLIDFNTNTEYYTDDKIKISK